MDKKITEITGSRTENFLGEGLKVLILEDITSDAELVKRKLSKSKFKFETKVVDNKNDFRKEMLTYKPHLILSDYSLPQFDALEALGIMEKEKIDIPFILVTGSQSEEVAVECIKKGAYDYLLKTSLTRLPSAIEAALKRKKTEEEKHKAQAQLKESEERYRLIAENSTDIITTHALDGTFIYVSPACKNILGYAPEELLGKKPSDFVHPDDLNDFLSFKGKRISSEDGLMISTYRMRKKNDGYVWIESSSKKIIEPQGKVENVIIAISRDVTERMNFQQELIKAKEKAEEMDRLKSNFLSNMSHELRTPMIGILGYSELLKSEMENPEYKDMAQTIFDSGNRLLETLNLLLDLSRIEADKVDINYSELNITDYLRKIIKAFEGAAYRKGLYFKTEFSAETVILKIDERLLREIANNIVNNAIKYTERGGITVKIYTTTDTFNRYAVFEVHDTGIGIPEDKKDIIFEEFRQISEGLGRSYEGTGLGLSITKKFIDKLNGTISVESEFGRGSIFTVKLPISETVKDYSD